MISSAAPGSNSWTWNSALRLMLLRLKVHCHLPINFQCGAYYLAANGKPTHAAHHLVDCISLINPCLPPHPHPPLRSCLFLFYLYFTQRRAEKTLNAKKKKWAFLLWGVSVCTSHLSAGQRGQWGGCYVAEVHHSHLPVCQMSCLAELHTVMVLTKWQEGGTLQWMSIWLQSAEALMLPHTKTDKKKKKIGEERGVVYKSKIPKEFHINIIYTRSRACMQRRTPYIRCSSPRVMRTHAAAKITSQQLQLSDTYQKSLSKCFLTFTIMIRWWWLGCERRFPVVWSRGALRSPSFSSLFPLSWRDG